jgi:hypothetical protein
MTDFTTIEPETAAAPVAELLTQVRNAFGLVPNMT